MTVLIYGNKSDCDNIIPMLDGKSRQCIAVDDFEELTVNLVNCSPDLVIVLQNGAKGMEGVYRARQYGADLPVFWFSDDKDFAIQSYRLKCTYFSPKPLTPQKLTLAFDRLKKLN